MAQPTVRLRRVFLPVVLASVALAGCGGAGGASTLAGGAGKPHPKNGRVAHYAYLRLSPCSVRSGGYDVRIHGISCRKAERLMTPLGNRVFTRHPRKRRELVYRSTNYLRAAGWTCWGKLLHRYGPLNYVCFRQAKALLFKIG